MSFNRPRPIWVPELLVYLCSGCKSEADVGIAGRGSGIYCREECFDDPRDRQIGEDDGRYYGEEPAPEWLEHLSVLRCEAGDIVVIRCAGKLTIEAAERIRESTERALGGEHQVMVLEGGVDIGVIRG